MRSRNTYFDINMMQIKFDIDDDHDQFERAQTCLCVYEDGTAAISVKNELGEWVFYKMIFANSQEAKQFLGIK